MDEFKINNMQFEYATQPMMVNVNFTATFDSGNTVAGKVGLTLEEFNGNTGGLVGFSKLVKNKLITDFEGLETAATK